MRSEKYFRYTGIFICLFMLKQHSFGQQSPAAVRDSLLLVLSGARHDSTRSLLHNELGRNYANKEKNYRPAIEYFLKALSYEEEKGHMEAAARICNNIGSCYTSLLDIKNAIVWFEKALQHVVRNSRSELLPRIYMNLIRSESTIGHAAKSLEYSEQLLKLGETRSDNGMKALGYYYIGYCYHAMEHFDKAMQSYSRALANYETVRDTAMIARLQINIGEYYLSNGNTDSAAWYFNRSLETHSLLNDKASQAALYERLGLIYSAKQDYDNIIRLSEKSLALATEAGDQQLMSFYGFKSESARLIRLYSLVRREDGRAVPDKEQKKTLDGIIRNMESHLERYRSRVVNHREVSRMYGEMSVARELNQDYEGALNDFRQYSLYLDSFNSGENIKQFADVEAKYAFERSRDSVQLAEQQKRLELQKEMALNKLKFEFEQKRALAKTEEERRRLLLEEELKRKMIESEYSRKQDEARAAYKQQMALSKAEQEKREALSQAELTRAGNVRNMSLLGAGLLLVLAGGATWAYSQKRRDNKLIAAEKSRSDSLLLNILPEEVAEELKQHGSSQARRYEEVSVLFTDFVNFTAVSGQMQPEDLIAELNTCFTAFDHILSRYGIEKIKTIGDAYLAVSGLPVADTAHATKAVMAALDIVAFVKKRKSEHPLAFDIRVGIHSGPLVAGIVGVKKFAYDVWGDTVNTASRMESVSMPGKINISENTYRLVKDMFICRSRGPVEVKSKGLMEMYFVEKPNASAPIYPEIL